MKNLETYYLIGSWIPTIGEISFIDISKDYMSEKESESIENSIFIFDHLDYERIERVEIKNKVSHTLYAEIVDIKLDNKGYWQGKLRLIRKNQSTVDTWFSLLLNEIGLIIKEFYHDHLFHGKKNFTPISVEYKEIKKSEYLNSEYSNETFRTDVLLSVFLQYNRKFDRYKPLLIQKVSLSDIDDVFDFTVQIKGELIFYESFISLFGKTLREAMEDHDDYCKLTTKFVDIFYDIANFDNASMMLRKSNRIAGISLTLGFVSLFITIVSLIFMA